MQIFLLRVLILITMGLAFVVGAMYMEKQKTGTTSGVTSQIHSTTANVTGRIMNAMGSAEMGMEHDAEGFNDMQNQFHEYATGQDFDSEAAQQAFEQAQEIDSLDDVEHFEAELMKMGVIPGNWNQGGQE